MITVFDTLRRLSPPPHIAPSRSGRPALWRNRLSSAVARIARNCQGWPLPADPCRFLSAQFLHRRNGPFFFPTNSNGWKSQVLSRE